MFPFRLLKEVKEVATWSSPFLCETNLFLDEKTRKHLDLIKFVRQAAKSPFLQETSNKSASIVVGSQHTGVDKGGAAPPNGRAKNFFG